MPPSPIEKITCNKLLIDKFWHAEKCQTKETFKPITTRPILRCNMSHVATLQSKAELFITLNTSFIFQLPSTGSRLSRSFSDISRELLSHAANIVASSDNFDDNFAIGDNDVFSNPFSTLDVSRIFCTKILLGLFTISILVCSYVSVVYYLMKIGSQLFNFIRFRYLVKSI